MNKSFLVLLIACISINLQVNAQSYEKYVQQGKDFYNKSEYLTALERFDLAFEFAKSEADKNDAKSWKNKSREKIKQQQNDLKKALKVAETEKAKSDSLLKVAVEMQTKMETAIFDKAVKEKFPKWKGYRNYKSSYDIDFTEIIENIKELDLSDNELVRIPSQVAECKNLKLLNLFGNPDLDFKFLFQLLEKLNSQVGIYISISNIDNIPKQYHKYIKGIQYIKTLDSIPSNLYSLTDLEYIDLGEFHADSLPLPLFQYKNLKFISLYATAEIPNIISFLNFYDKNKYIKTSFNKVNGTSLFSEDSSFLYVVLNSALFINLDLSQIKKLKAIDMSNEEWDEFPNNLSDLKSLTILNLSNNIFSGIPDKIGEFSNLEILSLNQNPITSLPESIKKLTKLKLINIRNTEIPLQEKQKLHQWLPRCKIDW